MLNTAALNLHLGKCHRCKFSQTQRGGCAGPCPCHVDGRDIIDHAMNSYCPKGFYPFAGLGSVVTYLLWTLRIPQILRYFRLFDPRKCKCSKRQTKLNRLGSRLAFWKGS